MSEAKTFPFKIKLKQPIKRGENRTVSEIEILRRPCAKDWYDVGVPTDGKMTFGDMMTILQKISDQPKSVIDSLDFEDMTEGLSVVSDFLAGGSQSQETDGAKQ